MSAAPSPPPPESTRLRAALDALPDVVIAFDRLGRVSDINRSAKRLLGCSQSELRLEPARLTDLLAGADRAWMKEALRRATVGEPGHGELCINGPEGPCRLAVQLLPLRDARADTSGRQPAVVLRGQRIGEGRAALHGALHGAGSGATSPLADYGLLTASLVHDLNNALSVLANSLDAASGELPELVRELAQDAMQSCRAVAEDLKRLGEGAVGTEQRALRLGPLLRQVCDELTESGPSLPVITLDERLGRACCMCDGPTLARVLRELGQRARRARATSLEIRAREVNGRLVVELRDDGLGMSVEELQRMARPHLPAGGRRRVFDFAVLRGAVRAHGGELEVASRPDLGSTFLLTLPAVSRAPHKDDAQLAPLPGRILLVEDDPELRRSLTWLLRARHVTVYTAGEGQEALAVLEKNPSIDLVLLDLALPNLDGLAVLQRLRERGDTTPVVMMSGYADDAQAQACAALGALGFLGKPFRLRELQGLLGRGG